MHFVAVMHVNHTAVLVSGSAVEKTFRICASFLEKGRNYFSFAGLRVIGCTCKGKQVQLNELLKSSATEIQSC